MSTATATKSTDWMPSAQAWLIAQAKADHAAWCKTPTGIKYVAKAKKKPVSPYQMGYRQPEWMDNARAAMNKNDEEAFKAIRQGVSIVGSKYQET